MCYSKTGVKWDMKCNIARISTVHTYSSGRRRWSNIAPRKYHILSYQLTGQYDHEFGFGKVSVVPDTLFFINRYDSYRVVEIEKGISICVPFEGECDLGTIRLNCADQPNLRNLFQKLLQHRNIEVESEYYACLSICYEIFSLICRHNERRYTAQDLEGRIRGTHGWLLEHYREKGLTVSTLAEMCGVSTKYYTALFKNLYQTTPAQYVIDLRLREAQALLASGQYSVGETAEKCGFGDIYYFSRIFRKKLNVSPREYKKRL